MSPEQAEAYDRARGTVFRRCGGRCELCGRCLTLATMHAHHRKLRSAGGPDCPCNLLATCGWCHEQQIHARPTSARGCGWIISRFDQRRPSHVPVLVTRTQFRLTCDGQRIELRGSAL